MPHRLALGTDAVEEERRVFHVAVTRCRETVGVVGDREKVRNNRIHCLGHDALPPIVGMQEKPDFIGFVHTGGANDALILLYDKIGQLPLCRRDHPIKVFLRPFGGFMRGG